MSEEQNPFLVKKKPVENIIEKKESFGTDEVVSFMVTKDEGNKLRETPIKIEKDAPHWEEAGTPVWDRKNVNLDNPDMEIVDHQIKKTEKKDK